jgi:hypothetical protein
MGKVENLAGVTSILDRRSMVDAETLDSHPAGGRFHPAYNQLGGLERRGDERIGDALELAGRLGQ